MAGCPSSGLLAWTSRVSPLDRSLGIRWGRGNLAGVILGGSVGSESEEESESPVGVQQMKISI